MMVIVSLTPLLAVVVGVAVGTLSGVVAPLLVARLPEPESEPEPDKPSGDTSPQEEWPEEPPKPLYVDLASDPNFRRWAPAWGLVSGGALGLAAPLWSTPSWWSLALWLLALAPLLALAFIDARTRLLPTRLVIPATLAVLVVGGLWGWFGHREDLLRGLIAMVVARSIFWFLWWIRRAGMGFGDVRLSALLGFLLGIISWNMWFVGLYAGILAFALQGIARAVVKRDRGLMKAHFPFGPMLVAGALFGATVGTQIGHLVGG